MRLLPLKCLAFAVACLATPPSVPDHVLEERTGFMMGLMGHMHKGMDLESMGDGKIDYLCKCADDEGGFSGFSEKFGLKGMMKTKLSGFLHKKCKVGARQ
jgi:hypothetical protein